MRPAQKLKRLLRVHVVREEQAQPILKIFGALYPRREETAGIKFTSFFREISYVYERDKTVLENVRLI